MKNLHFYIQSVLVLIAGAIALQIPFRNYLEGYVVMLELIVGFYQFGMGILLRSKLSKDDLLLDIHFLASIAFIFLLMILGVVSPTWMKELWSFAIFGFPWVLAIYFLIVIDSLEYKRNYRV